MVNQIYLNSMKEQIIDTFMKENEHMKHFKRIEVEVTQKEDHSIRISVEVVISDMSFVGFHFSNLEHKFNITVNSIYMNHLGETVIFMLN